jgi:hypothetical protein
MTRNRNAVAALAVEALCLCSRCAALADFAWSMFDGRSVTESLISLILGLVGTGWYVLAMWASSHNDPDDPNEPTTGREPDTFLQGR